MKTLPHRLVLMLCAIAWFVPSEVANAQQPNSPTKDYLELSRELLNKYYETQKVLSKEKADWKLGKEIMQTRIAMIESNIAEIKAKTKEEEDKVSKSDDERQELVRQDEALAKTTEDQKEGVKKLEARVHSLWPLLPDYLKSEVGGQYDTLPKVGAKEEEIKSPTSQRYLNVLLVLTVVNKFQTDITILNERRKLADGSEMEVETIYFGLATAYFAAGEGESAVAGVGLPGPKGWDWEERPEIAPLVKSVIAMNKGGELAEFVNLPVTIR